MTKPLVAFHWLRTNGRVQEKQNKQTSERESQPAPTNKSKPPKHKFIKLFKKRGQ